MIAHWSLQRDALTQLVAKLQAQLGTLLMANPQL